VETEQNSSGLEAALATLEAKRDEIEQAIKVVRGLIGQPPATNTSSTHKHQTSNTLTPTIFFGMGVADAAKRYLAIVKEPKTAPDIAKALQSHGIKTVSKNFSATVFSALDRCATNGEMVRPKRGQWGLAEWYPGLRRSKENGNKKDSTEATEKPKKPKASPEKTSPPPVTSSPLSAEALEDFVKGHSRRIKDAAVHFGVSNAEVKKLLEPASKVYLAGIAWLKLRE